MLKRHSQLFEGLFMAADLIVVSVAWALSYWVRFTSGWLPIEKGIPPFDEYLKLLVFVWAIWAFSLRHMGLYRPMRGSSRLYEFFLLVKANLYSVVVLLAVTYLFQEKEVEFSRLVFVIFGGLAILFTGVSRTLIRGMLRSMRRRGLNLRYAVIVGSGRLAQIVASRIVSHPEFGIELLGCLTSDPAKSDAKVVNGPAYNTMGINGGAAYGPSGYRVNESTVMRTGASYWYHPDNVPAVYLNVVGSYSDLPRILAEHNVDQIIIAMPLRDHNLMESVVSSVGDSMVDVRIVPDVHRFIKLGSLIEELDGLPVISLASTPLQGVNRVAKRVVDFLLSCTLLILASPLMLVLAALVKLTSRGPVFFKQDRVGLDGRTFPIYKFRTMTTDAEREGARFAVRNDPRVTPLGRIMRRFNLDELPQFVNVIFGQMSLVGPRPERPVFIKEFRRHVPRYMLRHKVQAGMTGWAQVNGWRGNTSIEKRIEHDLYYIENWSLGLDLKILGLTLVNAFRDQNAY